MNRRSDKTTMEQPSSLEEAKQIIQTLNQQNKMQGHLLVAWKRRLKEQSELIFRLHREREEQMRLLSSQLLLLEANMRIKQRKIEALLQDRQDLILQQEKQKKNEILVLSCQKGDESLEDSDSAVIIDDCPDPSDPGDPATLEECSRNSIKVIRSISDVVDNFRKQQMSEYSEDPPGSSSDEEPTQMRRCYLRGSLERCPGTNRPEATHHCSRVFSNHRSVTRPRDIKYRRNGSKSVTREPNREPSHRGICK